MAARPRASLAYLEATYIVLVATLQRLAPGLHVDCHGLPLEVMALYIAYVRALAECDNFDRGTPKESIEATCTCVQKE